MSKNKAEIGLILTIPPREEFELQECKDYINESNKSKQQYKVLVKDIIENIVVDNEDMKKCISVVNSWKSEISKCEWENELVSYCRTKEDILSVYRTLNNEKTEFILIMEDVTRDTYFDYSQFAFDFKEKYTEIYNFMILDKSINNLGGMFENITKLY